MSVSAENDGRHDFDFMVGTWRIKNRKLAERLTGCDTWSEFEAISHGQMILGGLGNVDHSTFDIDGASFYGVTLRLFNPVNQEWNLNWSDSATGLLFPPMIGRFEGDVGHLYGQEVCNRRTICSRFVWSDISETTARWEQSFSADGGTTWETNWIMESTKIGD